MRKIAQEAVEAFENARPYKKGYTEIVVLPNVTIMELHGNRIAYRYNDPERELAITTCGRETRATLERLNGIPGVSVRRKDGVLYLNGHRWNGELIIARILKKSLI